MPVFSGHWELGMVELGALAYCACACFTAAARTSSLDETKAMAKMSLPFTKAKKSSTTWLELSTKWAP